MSLPVAVVIVTYNSAGDIDKCLDSVQNVTEVVVVDNGSSDATVRLAGARGPAVRVVANGANRGFAAAANQGVCATTSPLVLFLNPDAALVTGLESMVAECQSPGVGAAGGRLIDENGETQIGFNLRNRPTPAVLVAEALLVNRLWPSNPVNRRYRCLDLNHFQAQDVEQPAGAFLMVRRDALHSIAGWDERFHPLWFEDVDLCLRLRRAGHRIRYVPGAVALHEEVEEPAPEQQTGEQEQRADEDDHTHTQQHCCVEGDVEAGDLRSHWVATGPTSIHFHASPPRTDRSCGCWNRTGLPSASVTPVNSPVTGS